MSESNPTPREPIDVHTMIMVMLEQMSAIAWQKMGLQQDPMTGKIEKDLDQAKVAVDVCSQLAEILTAKLDEDDKRSIRNMVSDLRINYMEQVKL